MAVVQHIARAQIPNALFSALRELTNILSSAIDSHDAGAENALSTLLYACETYVIVINIDVNIHMYPYHYYLH